MKERLIFHVDVNSAYLSWEAVHQLKNGAPTDPNDPIDHRWRYFFAQRSCSCQIASC